MPLMQKPLSLQGVTIRDPRETASATLADAVLAAVAAQKRRRRVETIDIVIQTTNPARTPPRVPGARPATISRRSVPRDPHSAQSLRRADVLAGTVDRLPTSAATVDTFRRPEGLGLKQRQLCTAPAAGGGLQRGAAVLRGLAPAPVRRCSTGGAPDKNCGASDRYLWPRDPTAAPSSPRLTLLRMASPNRRAAPAPSSVSLDERLLAEGHRRLSMAPSRTPASPPVIRSLGRLVGLAGGR